MKTILIAILFALTICFIAFMLNRNPDIDSLIEKNEKLEKDVVVLEDKFEADRHHAQRVIDEVRKIVTTSYNHIIPIRGGLLAIREEK